jgi:hypothetical protein
VTYPPIPPPTATLTAYEVVVWSSPLDSPGYIGADRALTFFLRQGGRLLVSGQDVASWDDGGNRFLCAPYLRRMLGTQYVRDSSGIFTVTGALGGPFAGLVTDIRGEGGARNQYAPDEIASADPLTDRPIHHLDDGRAVTAMSLCRSYRKLVFAFGLKGIPDPGMQGETLERSLRVLTAPLSPAGLRWDPAHTERVVPTATQVLFTATLQNLSEVATDTVRLEVEGTGWPVTLTPDAMPLGPCALGVFTLTVDVPAGLPRDAAAWTTVIARSTLSPTLSTISVWQLKTPARPLRVEEDRWYEVGEAYCRAPTGAGISFDRWRVAGLFGQGSPPEEDLARCEGVVWFTGYNSGVAHTASPSRQPARGAQGASPSPRRAYRGSPSGRAVARRCAHPGALWAQADGGDTPRRHPFGRARWDPTGDRRLRNPCRRAFDLPPPAGASAMDHPESGSIARVDLGSRAPGMAGLDPSPDGAHGLDDPGGTRWVGASNARRHRRALASAADPPARRGGIRSVYRLQGRPCDSFGTGLYRILHAPAIRQSLRGSHTHPAHTLEGDPVPDGWERSATTFPGQRRVVRGAAPGGATLDDSPRSASDAGAGPLAPRPAGRGCLRRHVGARGAHHGGAVACVSARHRLLNSSGLSPTGEVPRLHGFPVFPPLGGFAGFCPGQLRHGGTTACSRPTICLVAALHTSPLQVDVT